MTLQKLFIENTQTLEENRIELSKTRRHISKYRYYLRQKGVVTNEKLEVMMKHERTLLRRIKRLVDALANKNEITITPEVVDIALYKRMIAEYDSGRHPPMFNILVIDGEDFETWVRRVSYSVRSLAPSLTRKLYDNFGVSVTSTANAFTDYVANLILVDDARVVDKAVYRYYQQADATKRIRLIKSLRGIIR